MFIFVPTVSNYPRMVSNNFLVYQTARIWRLLGASEKESRLIDYAILNAGGIFAFLISITTVRTIATGTLERVFHLRKIFLQLYLDR